MRKLSSSSWPADTLPGSRLGVEVEVRSPADTSSLPDSVRFAVPPYRVKPPEGFLDSGVITPYRRHWPRIHGDAEKGVVLLSLHSDLEGLMSEGATPSLRRERNWKRGRVTATSRLARSGEDILIPRPLGAGLGLSGVQAEWAYRDGKPLLALDIDWVSVPDGLGPANTGRGNGDCRPDAHEEKISIISRTEPEHGLPGNADVWHLPLPPGSGMEIGTMLDIDVLPTSDPDTVHWRFDRTAIHTGLVAASSPRNREVSSRNRNDLPWLRRSHSTASRTVVMEVDGRRAIPLPAALINLHSRDHNWNREVTALWTDVNQCYTRPVDRPHRERD